LSAQRELQEHLIDRPGQPIYTKRVAILGHPAFQAGCRGFEPRLPLSSMNRLSIGAPLILFLSATSDLLTRSSSTCSLTWRSWNRQSV